MTQLKFSDFFVKLRNDEHFRARFAKDPAGTLKAEGFDPSKLHLPSHIDAASLDKKLDSLFSGQEAYKAPTEAEVEKMSPDELWSRFAIIKGATGAALKAGGDIPVVTAVVAYGTAPVTSVIVGKTLPIRNAGKPE